MTAAVRCLGVLASVALTVKVARPGDVGVPVIAPVAGLRVRPAGRCPDKAQVTGAVPPVEASVAPE